MRVLRFILNHSAPYRLALGAMVFAIVMVVLDGVFKPYVIKSIIDTVSGHTQGDVWKLFGFYCLSQGVLWGGWTLFDYAVVYYVGPLRCDAAYHFMEKLYSYPYTFFQKNLSGSLGSKVNDVFTLVADIVVTSILKFWHLFLLMLAGMLVLFYLHPFFGMSLLLWLLCFFGVTFLSIKKMLRLSSDTAKSKAELMGLASDYLSNMLSVKSFANGNFELKSFNRVKKGFLLRAHKQGMFLTQFYILQGFLTSAYGLSLVLFLIRGRGQVFPGDFAFVIMINFNIIDLAYQASHGLREVVGQWGSVDAALKLIEDIPAIQDSPGAKELKVTSGSIVFDAVHFQYPEAEPLFQEKSVSIPAGQKVGLVGYSGGGKTTFVNLILRLYDIDSGAIRIDGQAIDAVTQDSLRRSIAMIPQDPALFHRSLMDNIRYGRLDASDAEVMAAAKQAHAHEFIEKLPRGYATLVGERGILLSGGQRQRIAIARAILKNAPILILDEATSQLDSLTEHAIQESLSSLMRGKTTLVIAHRLSTLLHMDRILVFKQGKIIQDGSHAELLSAPGLYRTLWEAQVGGFLPD